MAERKNCAIAKLVEEAGRAYRQGSLDDSFSPVVDAECNNPDCPVTWAGLSSFGTEHDTIIHPRGGNCVLEQGAKILNVSLGGEVADEDSED